MPNFSLSNENNTLKKKKKNYMICKYIKAIKGEEYKSFTMEHFIDESKSSDGSLYLIVEDLTDNDINKIKKFEKELDKYFNI